MKNYKKEIKDWIVITIKIILCSIIAALLLDIDPIDCVRFVLVLYLLVVGVLIVVTKIVKDLED